MVAPFVWDEGEWFESNVFDQRKGYSVVIKKKQNLGFGGMLMKVFEKIMNEDNPPKR